MTVISVVHLTSVHSPTDVRIFQRECRALAEAGYRVTLVVPCLRDDIVEGVHINAVPLPRNRLWRMLVTTGGVYRKAIRHRADIYHFHDPELIFAGLLLRATRKKVVYDIHEDVPRQVLEKSWLPLWSRRYVSRLVRGVQRFAAQRFSAIVTANSDISAAMLGTNPQIIQLANFPMLDEFPAQPSLTVSRYTSGVVVDAGGLGTRTCTTAVVTAIGILPRSSVASLVLLGDCDSKPLQRELERLPGWQRVTYVGKVSREQMVKQLVGASLALVLFAPEPNNMSVRSNRFFEALAAGLPVIASDFPAWKDLVTRIGCGLLVDPEDPTAIAEAINYLFSHPAKAAEMGLRGRRAVVEKLNWASEKSKLLHLYRELTARSEPASASHISTSHEGLNNLSDEFLRPATQTDGYQQRGSK